MREGFYQFDGEQVIGPFMTRDAALAADAATWRAEHDEGADASPEMQKFIERQTARRQAAKAGENEANTLADRVKALAKAKKGSRYIGDAIARAEQAVKSARALYGLAGGEYTLSESSKHEGYMQQAAKAIAEARAAVASAESQSRDAALDGTEQHAEHDEGAEDVSQEYANALEKSRAAERSYQKVLDLFRKKEANSSMVGMAQKARDKARKEFDAAFAKEQASDLALDKAPENRSYDGFGRLHVKQSNISKANICEYYGREIPGSEELGLDPDKRYSLLRDPAELEKAAGTFNNLPLLNEHIPISADTHYDIVKEKPDLVVGSTGTDAAFEAPYLKNSLVVWAKDAIDGVESKDQTELSCAYRYVADITPGTFLGEPYDGVMRSIVGNHVAIIRKGRAGSDVVVGDAALPQLKEIIIMPGKAKVLSRKAALLKGALLVHLQPRLAQDAKVDFTPVLQDVTSKNFNVTKITSAIKTATIGKLAKDANIDDIVAVIEAVRDVEEPEGEPAVVDQALPLQPKAEDDEPESRKFLKDKMSAEDMKAYDEMCAGEKKPAADAEEDDDDEAKKKKVDVEAKDTKAAMDKAIDTAVKTATTNAREVRAAERAVRPYVGELAMDHDSAADVYRSAFKLLNVDVAGVHPSAFPKILELQPRPGSRNAQAAEIAMDAASQESFAKRFPGTDRIGSLG